MRVLVSGADGALGSAVVGHLRAKGHRVAALMGVPAAGARDEGEFDAGNLADEEAASRSVGRAVEWLGTPDSAILLVGGFVWTEVLGTPLETWRRMFEINVATAVATLGAAIPLMADGGAVALIGANSAQPAGLGFGPYGAAKSGVARLAETLAAELKGRRIRVNAVLPSVIDTPANRADMPDVDPASWTSPQAIAEALEFLVSPAARAINGACVPVANATL